MSWVAIGDDELKRLKRRFDESLCVESQQLNAWRRDLPFYSNGCLLCVENELGFGYAVETDDGALIPMDGSSAQIRAANERAGLELHMGNVIAYAMFFAGLLQASDGNTFPFVTERGPWLLDGGRMPKDLTPHIEIGSRDSGAFRVRAYLRHADVLFAALLEVKTNGEVAMTEDKFVGRIVPMQ